MEGLIHVAVLAFGMVLAIGVIGGATAISMHFQAQQPIAIPMDVADKAGREVKADAPLVEAISVPMQVADIPAFVRRDLVVKSDTRPKFHRVDMGDQGVVEIQDELLDVELKSAWIDYAEEEKRIREEELALEAADRKRAHKNLLAKNRRDQKKAEAAEALAAAATAAAESAPPADSKPDVQTEGAQT